jgi:hypothetical protein
LASLLYLLKSFDPREYSTGLLATIAATEIEELLQRPAGAKYISALCPARESVFAPVLASNSVMNEKQSCRIALLFYFKQSRRIGAPKRLLPVLFEEVTFQELSERI